MVKFGRIFLLSFLAATIDNTDDNYGVRTSMRRFKECRELQTTKD
jgi:hypothetical protein